ncbi:hypothetical protein MNV49_000090 [Pseudohyphozyma bogoriensis]|nr:hypothetical protein MNV49_000090 [Pseudohyphozyma bogoriensis]
MRRRAEEGRSYSSMSTYASMEGAEQPAWLDREYDRTRPMTSVGDVRDRDAEIAKSLRKLGGRNELPTISSGRERRHSVANPAESKESRGSSGRQRPAIPVEFVQQRSDSPPNSSYDDFSRSNPEPMSATRARRLQSQSEASGSRLVDQGRPASAAGLPSRSERNGTWDRVKRGSTGSGSIGSGSGILPYKIDRGGETSSESRQKEKEDNDRRKSASRMRALSILSSRESDSSKGDKDDVFQNGLRKLDSAKRESFTPPASATSQERRYSAIAAELAERKERLKSMDVGSEAWLSEVQEIRNKGVRSRASGSSGDTRSLRDVPIAPPGSLERDRTLRAINAVLAGQGLVANELDESPAAQPSTGILSRRRKSSVTSPIISAALARTNSGGSSIFNSGGRESSLSVRFNSPSLNSPSLSDHHRILHQAFDTFEAHFTPSDGLQNLAPESVDLVKRMSSMVQATTKLNSGLRALATATVEAQIEAGLDEATRSSSSTAGFNQFEKTVNSLLRASDDQVRSLTEGLIAFTRVDREKEKLRRDNIEISSRPVSRASVRTTPQMSSPKRAATSSPFEGATVFHSSSRPTPSSIRQQRLRDPLEEPDLPPTRRMTQSFSAGSPRLPYGGMDSPTPSGRRDVPAVKSPLSTHESLRARAPSRAATLGLPPPSEEGSSSRRGKTSSTSNTSTVRPTTPAAIRFPRSPSTSVDQTNATTATSPTRSSDVSTFPRSHGARTYSEAQGLDALGICYEEDRDDDWRQESSSSRALTDEMSDTASLTTPEGGRRARQRLSTGSIFRTGLTSFKIRRGSDGPLENPPALPTDQTSTSTGSNSPEEKREKRRKDVEAILRRATARSSLG